MTDRDRLLRAYLAENRAMRIRPGEADCALFAAGWIARVTGRDPSEGWRGSYRSLAEGRGLLRAAGFDGLAGMAAVIMTEVPGWMQAQTGDVALVAEQGEEACGIVGGPHIHVLRPVRGLGAVPRDRAVRVFRP